MSQSFLVQQHLDELAQHPHIDEIIQIKPLVYKLTYWPRDLESLYAEIPYTLKLTLPETYPEKPPFIAFLDKVHHLNIHPNTGQLSMPMLTEDWSPFLNLKAVINSLDEILQQPEEAYAATPDLLQQYQTDITTYVASVKEFLDKNLIKNAYQKQQHNYTEEQVEEVIQVDDFSEYKLKRPENNFDSSLKQNENQHQQLEQHNDFIKLQENQRHDYSFNHQGPVDQKKLNGTKNPKEQGSDTQLSVKSGQQSKTLQIKPPTIKKVDSELNSPRQNSNNIDQKTSLSKYEKILKQSNNLLAFENDNQHNFERLKQNMGRCKELINIFSEQLNDMEQNMEKNKSKRIKKLLQEKSSKLQQMILELFQISQKTRLKLMDMVRKPINPKS